MGNFEDITGKNDAINGKIEDSNGTCSTTLMGNSRAIMGHIDDINWKLRALMGNFEDIDGKFRGH